jgi:hypothetical protein
MKSIEMSKKGSPPQLPQETIVLQVNKSLAEITNPANNTVEYQLKTPIELNIGDSLTLEKSFLNVRGQNSLTISLDEDFEQLVRVMYYVPEDIYAGSGCEIACENVALLTRQQEYVTVPNYSQFKATNAINNVIGDTNNAEAPLRATDIPGAASKGFAAGSGDKPVMVVSSQTQNYLDARYRPPTGSPMILGNLHNSISGTDTIQATDDPLVRFRIGTQRIFVPKGNYEVNSLASIIQNQINGAEIPDSENASIVFPKNPDGSGSIDERLGNTGFIYRQTSDKILSLDPPDLVAVKDTAYPTQFKNYQNTGLDFANPSKDIFLDLATFNRLKANAEKVYEKYFATGTVKKNAEDYLDALPDQPSGASKKVMTVIEPTLLHNQENAKVFETNTTDGSESNLAKTDMVNLLGYAKSLGMKFCYDERHTSSFGLIPKEFTAGLAEVTGDGDIANTYYYQRGNATQYPPTGETTTTAATYKGVAGEDLYGNGGVEFADITTQPLVDGNKGFYNNINATNAGDFLKIIDVREKDRYIGTKSFKFEYNGDNQNRFGISNLHEPVKIPSAQQTRNSLLAVASTGEIGEQATKVCLSDTESFNTKNSWFFTNTKDAHRTTGQISVGDYSYSLSANGNVAPIGRQPNQGIDLSPLMTLIDNSSGVMVTSWNLNDVENTTKYQNIKATAETGTVGGVAIPRQDKEAFIFLRDCMPTNYYYDDDTKGKDDWEKTLWYRLGFTWDNFGGIGDQLESYFAWDAVQQANIDNNFDNVSVHKAAGMMTHNQGDTSIATSINCLGKQLPVGGFTGTPQQQSVQLRTFDTVGALTDAELAEFSIRFYNSNVVNFFSEGYTGTVFQDADDNKSIIVLAPPLFDNDEEITVTPMYDAVFIESDSQFINATKYPNLSGNHAYFIIASDIIPANYYDAFGDKSTCIGIVSKRESTNDTLFGDSYFTFQVRQKTKISNFTVKVLNPDGTDVDNTILDDESGFIFLIQRDSNLVGVPPYQLQSTFTKSATKED